MFALNLKGTTAMVNSMFYRKELYKLWNRYEFHQNRLKNVEVVVEVV